MKVVDFNNYVGASVDREENKKNGLREASPFFVNLPNVKAYVPSNPLEMLKNFSKKSTGKSGSAMEIDTLSTEITLAITTNLKLDLIDEKTKTSLVTKKKKTDKETHFVTF